MFCLTFQPSSPAASIIAASKLPPLLVPLCILSNLRDSSPCRCYLTRDLFRLISAGQVQWCFDELPPTNTIWSCLLLVKVLFHLVLHLLDLSGIRTVHIAAARILNALRFVLRYRCRRHHLHHHSRCYYNAAAWQRQYVTRDMPCKIQAAAVIGTAMAVVNIRPLVILRSCMCGFGSIRVMCSRVEILQHTGNSPGNSTRWILVYELLVWKAMRLHTYLYSTVGGQQQHATLTFDAISNECVRVCVCALARAEGQAIDRQTCQKPWRNITRNPMGNPMMPNLSIESQSNK